MRWIPPWKRIEHLHNQRASNKADRSAGAGLSKVDTQKSTPESRNQTIESGIQTYRQAISTESEARYNAGLNFKGNLNQSLSLNQKTDAKTIAVLDEIEDLHNSTAETDEFKSEAQIVGRGGQVQEGTTLAKIITLMEGLKEQSNEP